MSTLMSFGPMPRYGRIGTVALLLLALLAFAGAARAKKSYTYETDPIRLGMKALEAQDLPEAQKQFEEALANDYEKPKAHFGIAEVKRREGSYAEAENLYKLSFTELAADNGAPDFAERPAGLGLVYLRQGKVEEARAEFEKALALKGNLWLAQYGMARVALAKNDIPQAQKLLAKGEGQTGLKNGEDLYHYGQGLLLVAQNNLDEAVKEALKAFNMVPGDPEYGTLVADIYAKQGNGGMAINEYEKALAMPGAKPTAVVLHNLGTLYQAEKRYTDAIRRYIDAVKIDSTYAVAWKDMAALYAMDKRKANEAAGAWLRYTQLQREDPEGFLGLSQAYLKTKRYQPALEAAQAAFALDSTRVPVRLAFARASFMNKEKPKAAAIYSSIADTTQFTADDRLKLGQLKLDANELDAAAIELRTAVRRDSTLADAWYYLGFIDLKRDQAEPALANFQKAIAIDPENPNYRLNLGIGLLKQKKNPEAAAAFRDVVRLSPKFAPARIYLANTLMQLDSLSAAVAQYQAVREVDPKNASALRGLGLCYLRRGSFDQAAGVLKESVDIDPNSADGWAFYGQALASQNNNAAAVQALEKAIAIKPDHPSARKLLDLLKANQKGSAPGAGKNP